MMQIAFPFHVYDQQVADLIAAAASSVFCLICKFTHNRFGAEGTKLTVKHFRGFRWAAVLRLLLMLTMLLSVWEFCMVSVHCGKQNHRVSTVILQGEEGLSQILIPPL